MYNVCKLSETAVNLERVIENLKKRMNVEKELNLFWEKEFEELQRAELNLAKIQVVLSRAEETK